MIIGIIQDKDNAEGAINTLIDLGYNPKDMSVIMRDKADAEYISDSTGAHVTEGAVSGATTGGLIGGLAGLLIGVGAITIPGIGALLIGGPLAAALGLTGALASTVSGAVTGAVAGGLVGALVSLGVPEEEARVYEDRIKDGAILIAVPTFVGRADEVNDILADYGASQIREINTADTSGSSFQRTLGDDRRHSGEYIGAAGGEVGDLEEEELLISDPIRRKVKR